jgi:hypothetical protein
MQVNNNFFYYVDRQGNVQRDDYHGPLARIYRLVTSLWRNYNLYNVYQAAGRTQFQTINKNEDKNLRQIIRKKLRFTKAEWKGINQICSPSERKWKKAIDTNFFRSIAGNRAFNAKMSALIHLTRDYPLLGTMETLEALRAYSHKTELNNFVTMIQAADKAMQLSVILDMQQEPAEEEKLTIREVRALESLAKMNPFLNRFKEISEKNTRLSQLIDKSKMANQFISTITEKAEKEAPCKPGTFILYDMETDYALRGQRVSWLQRFIFNRLLGTNISHISVGYKDYNGKSIEAHMWGSPVSKFAQGSRSLGNYCFRTFTLDPKTLVDASDHKIMKDFYGDNWGDEVASEYKRIVRKYFDTDRNPDLLRLRNPSIRRLLAAIGFRYSLFQRSWEERAQFPEHKQVICSEFAVLSSLQCLDKLNQRIKKYWVNAGNDEAAAPKLNPPVRENRRLNRVVPHEVLQRSIATGTGKIVDQAPIIRKVVRCNTAPLMY